LWSARPHTHILFRSGILLVREGGKKSPSKKKEEKGKGFTERGGKMDKSIGQKNRYRKTSKS